ncbi:MAG: hypothetical protein Q8900_11700 [Bacillota bacterium]|nr:hypothetical protein [Bacillota bacterium]
MAYNIIDIIDKAINIAINRKNIYEGISKEKSNASSLKIISKALVKETEKTIQYYISLKNELSHQLLDEIDFSIYDKMSFLINEFNKKKYLMEINNPQEFFMFSYSIERDLHSLFVDIQGRFVKDTDDMKKKTYEILSDLITQKAEIILQIEDFLK